MSQSFEQQYEHVLHSIESAIMRVYREHPELLDYHVEDALSALASQYSAEQLGREPRPVTLIELRQEVYSAVKSICEWYLGRSHLQSEAGEQIAIPTPHTFEEIVACLRRLQKSVKRWQKHGGRQGYLNFVQQYVK